VSDAQPTSDPAADVVGGGPWTASTKMIPKVTTVLMVARLRRTCGTRPHDYEFEFLQTQHGRRI
jgi:hypothetical protein